MLSTGAGAFPNSGSARSLAELGFTQAAIGFDGIPRRVQFRGTHESIDIESSPRGWMLDHRLSE